MTPALIGGLVGVVIGLANFALLRMVADRMEARKTVSGQDAGAKIVRVVAWADLVILPLVGYIAGPMVLS